MRVLRIFFHRSATSDTSCGPPALDNHRMKSESRRCCGTRSASSPWQATGESSCSSLLTLSNGQRAGKSAQRELPALAARFLRTSSARLSEPIGGKSAPTCRHRLRDRDFARAIASRGIPYVSIQQPAEFGTRGRRGLHHSETREVPNHGQLPTWNSIGCLTARLSICLQPILMSANKQKSVVFRGCVP